MATLRPLARFASVAARVQDAVVRLRSPQTRMGRAVSGLPRGSERDVDASRHEAAWRTASCGARRSRHGPWAEAWRIGWVIGVHRRPLSR